MTDVPSTDPADPTAEDVPATTTDMRPHAEVLRDLDDTARADQFEATAGQAVVSAEALAAADEAAGIDRTANVYDGGVDDPAAVDEPPAPTEPTAPEGPQPGAPIEPTPQVGDSAVDGDGDPLDATGDGGYVGSGSESSPPATEPAGAADSAPADPDAAGGAPAV